MTAADQRGQTLARFRAVAAELFRTRPELRSAIFAVAQYWNDQADDEVHDLVVASPREVPVWPHFCDDDYGDADDGGGGEATPGELCSECAYPLGHVPIGVFAFERFCHESGSQDQHAGESFLPYAIARRRGEGPEAGAEVEVIGKLVRPAQDMIPDEPDDQHPWLALPRARELYELVCASPADDGPRRVLGDHLLEHDHPRGELIALSLAERLDDAGHARRDELLAAHGRRWISPLGAVIPETGAHWERGFLARAEVHARGDLAAVRGAPAWGTVETIRFLDGTELIDPAMVALRDVGPVRAGLRDLAAAPRPWAIERLHAVVDDDDAIDALWGAITLPRLSHLVLEGTRLAAALDRPRPPWWPRLARLTLWFDHVETGALEASRAAYQDSVPWVVVSRRSRITGEPGWEVATGPGGALELSLAGWHERATLAGLRQLVSALPRDRALSLVPSRHWAPSPADAESLAAAAGRPVLVASH